MKRHELGRRGEALAAAYLEQKGYRILERNYRSQRVELDLVCFDAGPVGRGGGEIVFVEVKTRSSQAYGTPEAAVRRAKQRHLIRAARSFLHVHRMERAASRFDVVAVEIRAGRAEVEHIVDAFQVG